MVQFLSINFFLLDFFNFCWVFQKFPFFFVTLYITIVKPTRCTSFRSVFISSNTLHVSDGLSVCRQEFKIVHIPVAVCTVLNS